MSGQNNSVENNRSLQELSADLLRLLDHRSLFSDAMLKCDGAEIPVHKCILSARSPVFEAMFQSDMQEGRSGIVNIVDIKLEVLQVMVKYLYSDYVYGLTDNIAEELLAAAEKYRLHDLKRICTNKLISILSVENVFNFLVLGDLHDINLKVPAMEFISKHKFSDLKETEGWKLLQVEHPKLAMEALESIVQHVQDSSHGRGENTYDIAIRCDEETISLNVKATDTIEDVKKKIRDKEGIIPHLQDLFVYTHLQDERTLSDYNIQDQSTLHLDKSMQIFVKTLTGKTKIFRVTNKTTVTTLKKLLQDTEGIPPDRQRLIYSTHQLKDGVRLSCYNIGNYATIHLVLRLGGCHGCHPE